VDQVARLEAGYRGRDTRFIGHIELDADDSIR
jgi:hypothetical protein